MENKTVAHLLRLVDRKIFPLTDRLTTIGSSKRCKIKIDDGSIPLHCAYILFNQGHYFIHPIEDSFTITCNGKTVTIPQKLTGSSIVEVGTYTFLFENGTYNDEKHGGFSAFHKLVGAINAFFRNVSHEARFEMLYSISQTLCCDGARLVMEDHSSNAFITIARYPQSSGLDRFSQRALNWAKQQKQTVLMSATDWETESKEQGSLELNDIGSILCMPIVYGKDIYGYLYLDRLSNAQPFTQDDWEICNALAPIFGDIFVLYEKNIQQQQIIATFQHSEPSSTYQLIFACELMKACIEKADQYAKTDSTVLLLGETGTGKEVFARFLHDHSNRSSKPFLVINCGAIPENLIESELFGHEKGSFTGAVSRRAGIFETADGGTVFLDEIGELPFNLQVKLLRVLQESEVLPVGRAIPTPVNVRVIAATNKNLLQDIECKKFRKDLYYRLNVLNIELPPLCARGNDVLLLANYFFQKYSSRFGVPLKQLTIASQSYLLKHRWPGNIRELENVIQKALLVAKGPMIESHDLDIESAQDTQSAVNTSTVLPLKKVRECAEKNAIINTLSICGGNVTIAANLLEIDRKWLTKLLKAYKIDRNG